jgi:eukaryotic-like serine/threonine-protein kinase
VNAPVDAAVRARAADQMLERVLTVKPDARDALIDALASGDPPLAALVRRLVASIGAPAPAIDRGLAGHALSREAMAVLADPVTLPPGHEIGAFRIVRRIGVGGMSEVYLARRCDEGFAQHVAIKLLRRDRARAGSDDRFVQERQILARLGHAHIARTIDVGVAPDGRPYLAMEHVAGEPIDAYCDRRRLGVGARVRLFLQVAGAVAHAHAALVAHGDIKPANVLVDADGNARLLDFGIARLLASSADTLARDGCHDAPLTPGYASPEQFDGAPVTIASDVFQLGALLHVLLSGCRPFDLRGLSRDDARTRLRENVRSPAALLRALRGSAPSDARTIAAARGRSVSALIRQLDGDVHAIVARAMAPMPENRYGAVDLLASDLRAWLAGRPVAAVGGGAGYVARRFARRHLAAVIAASALVLSLAVFAVVGTVLLWRLDAARLQATHEADVAGAALTFLGDTFRAIDPAQARGAPPTIADALDRGAAQLDERFAQRADVRARLHRVFGEVYESLGRYDAAEREFRAGARASTEARGIDSLDALDAERALGRVAFRLGHYDEALQRFTALRERTTSRADAQRVRLAAIGNLAGIYGAQGRSREALEMSREGMALRLALDGPDHPETLTAINNHAAVLASSNPLDDATLREALALVDDTRRRTDALLGADHPDALLRTVHYWSLATRLRRYDDSVPGLQRWLARGTAVLGAGHPNVSIARRDLGIGLAATGRAVEAEIEIRAARDGLLAALPPHHERIGTTLVHHAAVLVTLGRLDDARAALARSRDTHVDPALVARFPQLASL